MDVAGCTVTSIFGPLPLRLTQLSSSLDSTRKFGCTDVRKSTTLKCLRFGGQEHKMTILLVGGSGQTSSRVARILLERNVPVLLTSRRGQAGIPAPFKGIAFDWKDQSTYANPFNADAAIDRVYFVIPPLELLTLVDPFSAVKDFIDFAREKGVKRFVTVSAALIEKSMTHTIHGQTHEYLATCGVDYCILRPSTFFGEYVCKQSLLKSLIVNRELCDLPRSAHPNARYAALSYRNGENRFHLVRRHCRGRCLCTNRRA